MQRASEWLVQVARRRHLIALLVALFVVATPNVAVADAAGPTDWRTTIVAVEPAAPTVEFSIVGGDAFVRAIVDPGHELVVFGYDGEPYLRIDADGTVSENARSFATYYNTERYGSDDIPDLVDNDAPPEWRQVGEGGDWAWHDHRAHWMSETPIGLEPGDVLPAQSIPVAVDGVSTQILVETRLLEAPSSWPAVFGGLLGLQLGLLGAWIGRATSTLTTLVLASAATVAGVAQFASLPASTAPLTTWWLLPVLSIGAAVGVIVLYRRAPWVELGLQVGGAAFLLLWALQRRRHLTRSIVPTDLSPGLDRAITAGVLVGSALLLLGLVRQLRNGPTAAVGQPVD